MAEPDLSSCAPAFLACAPALLRYFGMVAVRAGHEHEDVDEVWIEPQFLPSDVELRILDEVQIRFRRAADDYGSGYDESHGDYLTFWDPETTWWGLEWMPVPAHWLGLNSSDLHAAIDTHAGRVDGVDGGFVLVQNGVIVWPERLVGQTPSSLFED